MTTARTDLHIKVAFNGEEHFAIRAWDGEPRADGRVPAVQPIPAASTDSTVRFVAVEGDTYSVTFSGTPEVLDEMFKAMREYAASTVAANGGGR